MTHAAHKFVMICLKMPITASTAASAQDGDAIPTDIPTDGSMRNEDSCNDTTVTSTDKSTN